MVVHIEVLTRASAQHEPSLLCNSVWPNSLIMWFSQIKKIVALLPVLMPESLKCSASTLPLPNVTSNYPLNSARFSSLFGKMGGMSSAKRKSSKCHPQDLSHAVDFQICIRTLRLKCSTELCFCPKSYFFSKMFFHPAAWTKTVFYFWLKTLPCLLHPCEDHVSKRLVEKPHLLPCALRLDRPRT